MFTATLHEDHYLELEAKQQQSDVFATILDTNFHDYMGDQYDDDKFEILSTERLKIDPQVL